ncbi:hypothetical protein CBB_A0022 [Clostridium botulinum Bf]|nr:hypothetical protein CBB_A0022 [Clostridium botulinum Bf]
MQFIIRKPEPLKGSASYCSTYYSNYYLLNISYYNNYYFKK